MDPDSTSCMNPNFMVYSSLGSLLLCLITAGRLVFFKKGWEPERLSMSKKLAAKKAIRKFWVVTVDYA